MILACTGHRPGKLNNEWNLDGPYSGFVRVKLYSGLIRRKPKAIISGLALGVDMIWAELGIEMGIPVWGYIPCLEQSAKWTKEQQVRYDRIIAKCARLIRCTDSLYQPGCMQIRNERMVDDSDGLVAVWDGSEGGTKNCYDYAKLVGKPIYRIDLREVKKYVK